MPSSARSFADFWCSIDLSPSRFSEETKKGMRRASKALQVTFDREADRAAKVLDGVGGDYYKAVDANSVPSNESCPLGMPASFDRRVLHWYQT